MMMKFVRKPGIYTLLDNVIEVDCERMTLKQSRSILAKSTSASSWYGVGECDEGKDVLQYHVTRANSYSSGPGHDYIFEYHVVGPNCVLYLMNDDGKTIDRIVV